MTIEERLGRLERQNRWLKGGMVSLLLAVVAVGLLGVASKDQVPDVVKARAFHVVGKDGAVLVKLEDAFGTGIGFGSVTTLNSEGRYLVKLGMMANGEGDIETVNAKGETIVWIGASASGDGMITTRNAKGQDIVLICVTEKDEGGIRTLNAKGQKLVNIGTNPDDGRGVVWTFDPSGIRAAGILAPQ